MHRQDVTYHVFNSTLSRGWQHIKFKIWIKAICRMKLVFLGADDIPVGPIILWIEGYLCNSSDDVKKYVSDVLEEIKSDKNRNLNWDVFGRPWMGLKLVSNMIQSNGHPISIIILIQIKITYYWEIETYDAIIVFPFQILNDHLNNY